MEQLFTEYLVWVAVVVGALVALAAPRRPPKPDDGRPRAARPSNLIVAALAAFLLGRASAD